MTETTMLWAREKYEEEVEIFLDDPEGYLCGDKASEAIDELNTIGRDLGTHFWEKVLQGQQEGSITQSEVDRLEKIIEGETDGGGPAEN